MDWSQINEYDEFKHGLVYLPTSISYWKNCPNASRILDLTLKHIMTAVLHDNASINLL